MSGTEAYEVKGTDLKQDSEACRRLTFDYKENDAVPAEMKEILSQFDATKSGRVTGKELIAAAHAMEQMKSQAQFMKKLVGMLVITMCLLVACVFASTVGAIELTKEVVVDHSDHNVLRTPSGENVEVASTDMTVEDGVLVAKTGDGARRLFPGKPTRVPTPAPSSFVPVPVKTASAEFFVEEVRPGYSTFQPRGAGKELVFKPTPTHVKDITTINRTELEEDGDDGEEGEFCLPCEQVREIAKRFSEGWAGPFVADTEDGSFAFTVTAWSANLLSVKGQGLPFEADLYYDEDGADETCCGSFVYHDQTTTDSDSESRRLSATEEQAPERGDDDVDGDESDEDDGDEMVPAQKRSLTASHDRKYAFCAVSTAGQTQYEWQADCTDESLGMTCGHKHNAGMPYIVMMHWCLVESQKNTKWARNCRLFDNDVWGRKKVPEWACPHGMRKLADPCSNTVTSLPGIKEYNRFVGMNERKHPGMKKCMGYYGQCFPATAQVRLQDGTTKTLEEVGPSDLVETTVDFQERGYERWLFDFHGSMGARQAVVVEDFVEFVHESEPPLRITPNHFLYVLRDGEPTLVLASSVVVGDVLLVTTDAGVKPSTISGLRMVKDRGIYAPLTFSGRLAVNGVVVSSYAASSSTMAKAWQLHQSLPWETMLAVGSAPFRYFFGYHLDSAFSRIMQAWSSVLPSMITDPRGRTSAATTVWSKLFDVTLWSWMANDRAVRAGEKLATTHAAEDERAEGLLAEGCDIGGSYVLDSQSTISKDAMLHELDALRVTSSHSGLR